MPFEGAAAGVCYRWSLIQQLQGHHTIGHKLCVVQTATTSWLLSRRGPVSLRAWIAPGSWFALAGRAPHLLPAHRVSEASRTGAEPTTRPSNNKSTSN